jgi:hypothetical protein
MNRETHVRICERLGVKLPGPTRQQRTVAAHTGGEKLLNQPGDHDLERGSVEHYAVLLTPQNRASGAGTMPATFLRQA